MKPAAFEFCRPSTLEEALAALQHDDAKILAGGQSLVPMMNFRLVRPERLVDINNLSDLCDIRDEGDAIRIGALVRHAQAAASTELCGAFPIVTEAMAHVAHVAIRNRGTIGGSLAHADPSAEWPLLITLLDGEIEIAGSDGTRIVGAEEFFFAPLVTAIEETEILVSIKLQKPTAGTGMAFTEVAQRAGDFAVVAAAATVHTKNGLITRARLALGGVGDFPLRMKDVEEKLEGMPPDAIDEAIRGCADVLEPNDDMHASSHYRRSLVPTLASRVLKQAAIRAAGVT
ncbi:FAD binding domain-containing protein [Pseudohoeflea coraliihabitans]|uniref:Xanthine dehydrogenase family protein subunit M n=1 Tax=Pseudohoeflea coraliihabitans TaxID=2860393 RepID=A0ABS6WN81_9HYPH|nr:xanthine dehydrogenase family protein subunit M [Pseudohoeflea sp. DP4N28-3]MBW3097418.1 xanthine dehydrogenase family protein subunit M [Pseudohoeflea sp. DP4N28-3]